MCTPISVDIHSLRNEQRLGSGEVENEGCRLGGERVASYEGGRGTGP